MPRSLQLFLFVILITCSAEIFGQCSVAIQVNPPYSIYLNDYLQQANRCVMSVTFSGTQPRDVRFRMILIGSNGVEIKTSDQYQQPTPFRLQPGQQYFFTGSQLSNVINIDHVDFKGISREQLLRTGQLPEGSYQFCAQVFDYQTGQPLSQPAPAGCSNFFDVRLYDAPILTLPTDGAHIPLSDPPSIIFSWLAPPGVPGAIHYRLRIAEVLSGQTPFDAIHNATTLLFDKTLQTSTYIYQPGDPKLAIGKHYAVTVTARDPMNAFVFKNGGESDIHTFHCDNSGGGGAGGGNGGNGGAGGGVAGNGGIIVGDLDPPPIPSIDTFIRPPTPATNLCALFGVHRAEPQMQGGLHHSLVGKEPRIIPRDGFLPLRAVGIDYDIVRWNCLIYKDCKETPSEYELPLTGRVKFAWSIADGEGSFAEFGALPEARASATGENVIFKPPYVPIPRLGQTYASKVTKVKLSIIDDNRTQPDDGKIDRVITITTKRAANYPNQLTMEVHAELVSLPSAPKKDPKIGTCEAKFAWLPHTAIAKPEIMLPTVKDNDKIATGELVVLEAKQQRDYDQLKMICESRTCVGNDIIKVYEDDLHWEWTLDPPIGKIIGSPGRFIVYEAPKAIEGDVVKVKVKVTAKNPNPYQSQESSEESEIELTIYRTGIQLDHPPLTWIPKDSATLDLTSRLVYWNNDQWNPALAHMKRVLFFELDPSYEPGICMNAPISTKANRCPDLSIADSATHELFERGDHKCKGLFLGARTLTPVSEYRVKVRCHDFGAFGYLASFASTTRDTSEPDHYVSIPWRKGDIHHPLGREKRIEYTDNRVTIPHDVDENRIADTGWSVGEVHMPDPAKNDEDIDDEPKGDGFNGDGLTAYEEYRGFMVNKVHTRTHLTNKDLFIHNPDKFDLSLFEDLSKLTVHVITAEEFNTVKSREVNFNHQTPDSFAVQRGLWLRDKDPTDDELMGEQTPMTGVGPAPPAFCVDIRVSRGRVKIFSSKHKIDAKAKERQIVAHELSHGCNVYHHGDTIKGFTHKSNGVRSGNMSCIMRYDNLGGDREAIGHTYCTSRAATGTNADAEGLGDAAPTRGNCLEQLRVSGKTKEYPSRMIKTAEEIKKEEELARKELKRKKNQNR